MFLKGTNFIYRYSLQCSAEDVNTDVSGYTEEDLAYSYAVSQSHLIRFPTLLFSSPNPDLSVCEIRERLGI
jgi:hypothetical protein